MIQKEKKIFILLVIFIGVGVFTAGSDSEKQPLKYSWPLNIDNGFSRSFQEYGYNHFHGGIDLRTFQETGFPVYAIADGEIFKIRIEKRGSGRGLYLKHRDGNTSIYFHLDKFAPQLENIRLQLQQALGEKYFGNYFLKNPVPVKEGELIAYSGETGAGFPHLHLEIRDPAYYAINPFPLLKFPRKDRNFPVLKGIILRSRGDSLLNGEIGEQFVSFRRRDGHVFSIPKPLLISGKFEAILYAFDISDTGKYTAPYEISAYIDNQRYFRLAFDRFNVDDNNQLGFVYDMSHSTSTAFFYNLFFQEGFALERDKNNIETIIENISPGEHLLKIEVKDNQGNLSTALVPFFKIPEPVFGITGITPSAEGISLDIEELQANEADRIIIKLYNGEEKNLYTGSLQQRLVTDRFPLLLRAVPDGIVFLDFNFYNKNDLYFSKRFLLSSDHLAKISDVSFNTFINGNDIYIIVDKPKTSAQNIKLEVIQGKDAILVEPRSTKNNLFFRFQPPGFDNNLLLRFQFFAGDQLLAEIQKQILIIHLIEGKRQSFKYEDFQAVFAPRSVYEPKVLQVKEKKLPSSYPVLSKQVSLSPYNFPFLDTVYYRFKKDVPNPKQAGIFKYSYKHKFWHYVFTTYDYKTMTFQTKRISSGTFALLRDIFPPEIHFSRPQAGYLKNVRSLNIIIKDKGKGVNDNTLKIYINGTIIDCEYDPDRNVVKIDNLGALKKGENRIYIRIKDYAGNTSEKTYRFPLN